MAGVAVGVDEAGHDHLAMGVDGACGAVLGLDLGARAHCDDAVAFDRHGAVVDDAPLRVHGDDRAAGDENVRHCCLPAIVPTVEMLPEQRWADNFGDVYSPRSLP